MEETDKEKQISKIRTLKDDLAKAVKSGGVTTAKIAIKEQQRRMNMDNGPVKKSSDKLITVIVSFFFIFLSLGIFVVLRINPELSFFNKKEVVVNDPAPITLFENESNIEVSTTVGRGSVVSTFDNLFEEREGEKIKSFNFFNKNNLEESKPLSTEEFFRYIQSSPGTLERSIENITYGLDGGNPFLLLTIRDFETTFAGMLEWEKTMTRDLEPVFQNIREVVVETEILNPDYIEEATEEGEVDEEVIEEITEETPEDNIEPEVPKTIIQKETTNWRSFTYKDEIFFNKDARVLTNDLGERGIIYTFIDKNYLLIATDISTIKEMTELISSYYIANY